MYYPQPSFLSNPQPQQHYSQSSRPMPTDLNQSNRPYLNVPFEAKSPLKSSGHSQAVYGFHSMIKPTSQSSIEAPRFNPQSPQKSALQALPKNIAPDYYLPTINNSKSPTRAAFNQSGDSLSQQMNQLSKMLIQDQSPKPKARLNVNLDDKSTLQEPVSTKSPVRTYLDVSSARLNGSQDYASLSPVKEIGNRKLLQASLSRNFDEKEMSPVPENRVVIQPKKDNKYQESYNTPSSLEKLSTLDNLDEAYNKLNSPYLQAQQTKNYEPQVEQNPSSPTIVPKRRGPTSLTTIFQSPRQPALVSHELYTVNPKTMKSQGTIEFQLDGDESIVKNSWHRDASPSPTKQHQEGPEIRKPTRIIGTFLNLKPARSEPNKNAATLQRSDTSLYDYYGRKDDSLATDEMREANQKLDSKNRKVSPDATNEIQERQAPSSFIQRIERRLNTKKIQVKTEKEPAVESQQSEPSVEDPARDLKEMFRKNTEELSKNKFRIKRKNGEEEPVKLSAQNSLRDDQDSPRKLKADIQIKKEERKKLKEAKTLQVELSEILEKEANDNGSEMFEGDSFVNNQVGKVPQNTNLVDLLADLDEMDNISAKISKLKSKHQVLKNKYQ